MLQRLSVFRRAFEWAKLIITPTLKVVSYKVYFSILTIFNGSKIVKTLFAQEVGKILTAAVFLLLFYSFWFRLPGSAWKGVRGL